MRVLIMGCGRVGAGLAQQLQGEGHEVTILDTDAFAFRRLLPKFGGRRLHGSGTDDRLLPYPAAAERFRRELPQADWVELDGVGHGPQLDVPLETAQLILGFTAP